MKLCKEVLADVHYNKEMQAFLGLWKWCAEDSHLLENVLTLVPSLLSARTLGELFVFSGRENSGIRLEAGRLPHEGFGFCGAIRIERGDESTPAESVIFKLSAAKESEIELFLSNNHLNYRVHFTRNSA